MTVKDPDKLPQRFQRFEQLGDQGTVSYLNALTKRLAAWCNSQPEAAGDWIAAIVILMAMASKQQYLTGGPNAADKEFNLARFSYMFENIWDMTELGKDVNLN